MVIKTPKQIAKELRKGLKKDLGLNRNNVSVKVTGSDIVEVEVKLVNAGDTEKIKEYAKQFEDVERDEITGEVLAGGNTFIRVVG